MRLFVAAAVAAAILVLGVAQLVLPGLAADRVRQRLARDGRVLSVSVAAFPAVELLVGDADSVKVGLASFSAGESRVASHLQQASGVSELTVHVGEVHSGLITAQSVTVLKHGNQITASGTVSLTALRGAVPFLASVSVLSGTSALTLQGTARIPILGRVSADVVVGAVQGKVVVSGAGLLGSFVHLTVWSSPHIYVQSISGRLVPAGLLLSARAVEH